MRRGVYALNPATPADRIVSLARAAGATDVIVPIDLAGGRDTMDRIEAAGLGVTVNVPMFHDPAFLDREPDSFGRDRQGRPTRADWLRMACPLSVPFWEYRLRHTAERLAELRPAAVSLDFARTFVFWELVRPGQPPGSIEHGCYCARCCADAGQPGPPRDEADRQAWGRQRTEVIARRVRELSGLIRDRADPVTIGLKLLPWRPEEFGGALAWAAGQDARLLAPLVDRFLPMSFTHLTGHPTTRISDLVADLAARTGRPVVPGLQLDNPLREGPLPVPVFQEMLAALQGGDCWLFHLDAVADRPDLIALLPPA
jgi:hypothetical protein